MLYILTDMYPYVTPAVLCLLYFSLCLCFHFVSGFDHSLSVSSWCSHLDFYRAKVVTAGNTENTGNLLAENFS